MAGEVAAVDRRDVGRLEHPQLGEVVPVEEVAAEAAHPLERAERRSSRAVMLSIVMNPRSYALTVARSWRPMLVGEVRIATTGAGSSWKLSGASQCVSLAHEPVEDSASGAARSAWRRPPGRRNPPLASHRRRAERVARRRARASRARRSAAAASRAPQSRSAVGDGPPRQYDQRQRRRRPARPPATSCATWHRAHRVMPLGLRGGLPLEQALSRHEAVARACARSRRPRPTPGAAGRRRRAPPAAQLVTASWPTAA